MLKKLVIKNFALIDNLEIELSPGLLIITGETGAGKSILLGALSMLLGNRADSSVLFDKSRKCIIEGEFDIRKLDLQTFFSSMELDYEDTAILRREISADGKSRSFINDTPVNASSMKDLGRLLVDIHSQHETLSINSAPFQLSVVDAFASNLQEYAAYKNSFRRYQDSLHELKRLSDLHAQANAESDFLQFQFNELHDARLDENEQDHAERELEMLNNADEIRKNLNAVSMIRDSDDERSVLRMLNECSRHLLSASKFVPDAGILADRIKSAEIEIKDIVSEAERIADSVSVNPQKAEILNERLALIYRLQQKHRVATVAELLALRDDLSMRLGNVSGLSDAISGLEKNIMQWEQELWALARDMSAKRKNVFSDIEGKVSSMLESLGMPHALLKIEHHTLSSLSISGIDDIRFMFRANKGGDFRETGKAASGGELSRLMLCIKSLIARMVSLPTIIFDEIDTGVSGEVALKMGAILEGMGQELQVVVITHLPQVAGKGASHLYVYKEEEEERTLSKIRPLLDDERVMEIARMIGGDRPSQIALENARELLGK